MSGVHSEEVTPLIEPVRISYKSLQNDPQSLHDQVSQAFGSEPRCLGIILIDRQSSNLISMNGTNCTASGRATRDLR